MEAVRQDRLALAESERKEREAAVAQQRDRAAEKRRATLQLRATKEEQRKAALERNKVLSLEAEALLGEWWE